MGYCAIREEQKPGVRTEVDTDERALPSFAECYAFPLSTPEARRDLLVGGTLLFTLVFGWICNLGQRLEVVGRLHRGEYPYFRGFSPWGHVFRRGLEAFAAIAIYLSPAAALTGSGVLAFSMGGRLVGGLLAVLAAGAFVSAVYVLPGGMTYNAAFHDMSYLYRPDLALRRAIAGGRAYLRAWLIALTAIGLSLLGLLAFGVGFFYTSVWAWTVVGYAFSKALLGWKGPSTRLDELRDDSL